MTNQNRSKILYIFRGLPGSGKSSFASTLGCMVHEPQDHWHTQNGLYLYDENQCEIASKKSLYLVDFIMKSGYDLAIAEVLPNFISLMQYFQLALNHEYEMRITEILISEETSKNRNKHNVKHEDIARFTSTWESNDYILFQVKDTPVICNRLLISFQTIHNS
jgi:tRNA uridine 5-carbamoylmethylation protein Kti12